MHEKISAIVQKITIVQHIIYHLVAPTLAYWGQELEVKETQQLGFLSRDKATDKVIGKVTQVLSFWKQILLIMKERYCKLLKQVYHHGGGYPVPEGISYAECDL